MQVPWWRNARTDHREEHTPKSAHKALFFFRGSGIEEILEAGMPERLPYEHNKTQEGWKGATEEQQARHWPVLEHEDDGNTMAAKSDQ
jgi:hypothetical protein